MRLMLLSCAVSALTLTAIYHIGSVKEESRRGRSFGSWVAGVRGPREGNYPRGSVGTCPQSPLLPFPPFLVYSSTFRLLDLLEAEAGVRTWGDAYTVPKPGRMLSPGSVGNPPGWFHPLFFLKRLRSRVFVARLQALRMWIVTAPDETRGLDFS